VNYKSKIISLRGSDHNCFPRILWQQLFNFYREKGGDLNNLDNLLIDHDCCKKLFEEMQFDGKAVFIFGCDSNYFTTEFIHAETLMEYKEDLKRAVELFSICDFHILCEVTAREIKITELYKDEKLDYST